MKDSKVEQAHIRINAARKHFNDVLDEVGELIDPEGGDDD